MATGCNGTPDEAAPRDPPLDAEPVAFSAPETPCGPAGQIWQDLAISPDGHLFALQARSGAIALQRIRDGAHVRALRTEGEGPVHAEFVRGGARLAVRRISRNRGNTIALWDVPNGRILRELSGGWIKAVAPSGEAYVSGSYTGRSPARLLRLSDDRLLWEYPDSAERVIFSPDGSRVVVQLDLDRYAIWSLPDGAGISRVDRIRGTWMVITPDASLLGLLTEGANPFLTVWRSADGARFDLDVDEADRLTLSTARLRGFSPDGKVLVVRSGTQAAGRAPWIALWSTEQGGAPRILEGLADAAFLPDGRLLTIGPDGAITMRAGGIDAPPLWQLACGGSPAPRR